MVTDRDPEGMRVCHVKDLRNCHGFATDLLRTATDRFTDEKPAQRIGLVTVFLIRKPFPCQSVADSVRSGNVFMDIYCRRRVKDVRNATGTSRMDLGTIRTLTDEPQMRYGRATDTLIR